MRRTKCEVVPVAIEVPAVEEVLPGVVPKDVKGESRVRREEKQPQAPEIAHIIAGYTEGIGCEALRRRACALSRLLSCVSSRGSE